MNEQLRNQLKNFVTDVLPNNDTLSKEHKKIDSLPQNRGGNIIIGDHNLVFTNSLSFLIFLATVFTAVVFFW